ncbi:MAG: hypothetical protein ACREUY_05895, partial [Burkholderiales bacterium]
GKTTQRQHKTILLIKIHTKDLQNSKLSQPEASLVLIFQALAMGWRKAARYGIDFSLFCPWQSLASRRELFLNSVLSKVLRLRLTTAIS